MRQATVKAVLWMEAVGVNSLNLVSVVGPTLNILWVTGLLAKHWIHEEAKRSDKLQFSCNRLDYSSRKQGQTACRSENKAPAIHWIR